MALEAHGILVYIARFEIPGIPKSSKDLRRIVRSHGIP
jgi:hypothetical protein